MMSLGTAVLRRVVMALAVIGYGTAAVAAPRWSETQAREWYARQPILCTEYMARGNGSTFAGSLPIFKRYNVAAINWGLVQGKAQTHLPWDSWRRPYVDKEPAVWFHEVFRNDGTPYDPKETMLIKSVAAAPAGR